MIDYIPHYPYFADDFQRKTRHLTLLQKGALRELMDEMWLTGQEDDLTIPDDPDYCASVLHVSVDEWLELRAALVDGCRPVLKSKNGRLYSSRLREEFDNAKRLVKLARERGIKSGKSRRLKSTTGEQGNDFESVSKGSRDEFETVSKPNELSAPEPEPTKEQARAPVPVSAPDWDAVARLSEITTKTAMRPGPDEQMLGIWVGMFGEQAVADLFRNRGPDLKGKHYKYAQTILQRQKDNPDEPNGTDSKRTNRRAASPEVEPGAGDRPSRFARFDQPGWRQEDVDAAGK